MLLAILVCSFEAKGAVARRQGILVNFILLSYSPGIGKFVVTVDPYQF